MPKGILKNARDDAAYKHESPNELDAAKAVFDRQQVIENTKLNAALTHHVSKDTMEEIQGKQARGETLSEEEQLKWDERNLLVNEMEKSATMKIDEPKTPYEGGFNPNNDYYRTDNENENENENGDDGDDGGDDDFDLGEGVDDSDDVKQDAIEVSQDAGQAGGEAGGPPEEREETAEERHRRFEERRKAHYFMKAAPLKRHDQGLDDPEEDHDA